jgi:hypothetical protein
VRPAAQVAWQTPLTQATPEAQAFPQLPQFAALVLVSTHAPLQTFWPLGQLAVQTPLTQA